MHSLDKQRVLVIGGTSGIGLATAAAAATIASRNQKKLDTVAAKLGGAVQTRVLGAGDNGLLERFFQKEQAWDHVLVSAAQTKTGPVRGMSLADAAVAMESKFWGGYRVAPGARINDGGSLTLISGFLSGRPSATAVLQGAVSPRFSRGKWSQIGVSIIPGETALTRTGASSRASPRARTSKAA